MRVLIKNILFALFALLLTASCVKNKSGSQLEEWMADNGKLKILSTIAQIGDLAAAVGGERIDSWVLVPKDLDPHSYELVKGDGEKVARADVVFYNGLGLEHGASLSALLHASPKGAAVGDGIRKAVPDEILERNGVADPHVWMDVSLWQKAAGLIAAKLSEADPAGAEYYRERAALLEKEMESTHIYILKQMHEIPSEKRFLVTSHDAFSYFTRRYLADPGERDWSKRFTAPEGLAPDGQLNPADIRRAIDFLRTHRIRVVFPESNVSRDAVAKIASAGKQLGLDVSLCDKPLYGDSPSGHSYLEMMRLNAETISQHLFPDNTKRLEFSKEAPQTFQAQALRSERPLPIKQGGPQHENFEEKPMQHGPPINASVFGEGAQLKTDSSGCFGIDRGRFDETRNRR